MKYKQLVVNGCSYMHSYASGLGHDDLANKLGIDSAQSIAIPGSANSRILRTTLKHSYATTVPTFYVLGITFVSRLELPICEEENSFEGRWINPQNQEYKSRWQLHWHEQDSARFVEIKLKSEVYSIVDRTEDLMYRMLSVITDLKSRGHQVLMYQQADNLYQPYLTDPKLSLLKSCPEIVHGLHWRSITYQNNQGVFSIMNTPKSPTSYQNKQEVPVSKRRPRLSNVPADMMHPEEGHHEVLNTYLTNYINKHKILQ